MHADLKYVESLGKKIDELEFDKAEFSNMYDMLLQECVSNDVMCSYLHLLSDLDEITELQCLYLHKVKKCDCLAQKLLKQTEFVSKEVYTELLRSFAKLEKHSISLELTLQKCQEQMKNDTVCKEKASNKLIEKCKGKSIKTKFDKPSVVRQPNAQRISKPLVLGKPAPFSDSLKKKNFSTKKSVSKTNESEGLLKTVTTQKLPQTATQAIRNTNVIKPGMYRIKSRTKQTRAPQLPQTSRNTNPRVSTSTGVIHRTNVSRPQLMSTQMKDKVVPNNSHVKDKKTEVEDHHRISSISNKTKSVTASNDILKSRTSNVNAVCATYGKCVFNSNHDACVSKYLNDVNARTKKPNVVPISTRKPKSQANKSVATPHKETVASESTTQKSKSYYRMLLCNSSYSLLTLCKSTDGGNPNAVAANFVVNVSGTRSFLAMDHLPKFLVMEIWFKEIPISTGFITSKASITIFSRLVNFVMRIWRLLSRNLRVLLEIFRETIYSWVTVDLISIQFPFKKQRYQLHSVSWLKPHQLKHGYGIEDFLILTSTTSTCLSKEDVR
ncbi:hypothetical protein Tco_0233000 [Tanacetum coccineum]